MVRSLFCCDALVAIRDLKHHVTKMLNFLVVRAVEQVGVIDAMHNHSMLQAYHACMNVVN